MMAMESAELHSGVLDHRSDGGSLCRNSQRPSKPFAEGLAQVGGVGGEASMKIAPGFVK